jgi:hypothetical protein
MLRNPLIKPLHRLISSVPLGTAFNSNWNDSQKTAGSAFSAKKYANENATDLWQNTLRFSFKKTDTLPLWLVNRVRTGCYPY